MIVVPIKKPCSYPGCRELVDRNKDRGRCKKHRWSGDAWRGSAGERGYGYRWQKYTQWFKKVYPLCRECERAGLIVPMQEVDHVVPVKGADDPLFWRIENHQGLCKTCHSRKTRRENS